MHIGISPVRISFAGGGTDMPEYYEKYGGNVVSTAISLFTYLMIKPRKDDSFQAFSTDFEIHQSKITYKKLKAKAGTEIAVSVIKYLNFKHGADFVIGSDVQPGSGLGASSSLTVNFINTISKLQKKKFSNKQIAEKAFFVERNLLLHPIGKQDDYVASYGGLNYIKFNKNKTTVTPIKLSKSKSQELQNNLLLFFIGTTRKSSTVLTTQLKKTKNLEPTTLNSLHKVNDLGKELFYSLKKSDLNRVGEILDQGWKEKKNFTKQVSNPKIDKIYENAIQKGAIGGKLTGAGAGGHMLFYCEPKKQTLVKNEMKHLGLKHIDFKLYQNGPKILNLYDFI
ncbi:D-glycero-D-manno-heptose 7-phosphate kinase [Nitrosopumilus ureiphilus]|uniref:D-glycero-D-manno-heptose 7-phosphate kinase n=1 Tax=Nitrosopumilus ureiphilus TaxID=1470067 RepID=A0A7D5M496_9ARCH|nr:D-glycero-D-manno-heptose 7-phosphate kinase [Nitrosopumilus ureiphilus]QLH05791.1 D-glycero-D-manno-heptose 7-phosphate kinase [Nitrosopumilus ureiphilus]